jgi:hypothetical protein
MFPDYYYGQHNVHTDWMKIISGRTIKDISIVSKRYRYIWSGDKLPKDDNYYPYF